MISSSLPKITFGIIVFNGEPFTEYCLRGLYPFAHEIIVVEGACPGAATMATRDGHSTDGTLERLYRFRKEEDPEGKIQIVVRDELWSEKHEQSQAYAKLATGDYLWQVDIDEFYKPEDMSTVLTMLNQDTEISAISFQQIPFWGGFQYKTDSWFLRAGAGVYHRLFKWGDGYRYVTHRPPTVHDSQGRDVMQLKAICAKALAQRGIFLYHYSLVFPKQVREKCEYYSQTDWASVPDAPKWATEVFLELRRPFRVHNVYRYPSWLERYSGTHPPQIEALRQDLKLNRHSVAVRQTEDIESLLNSFHYQIGRRWLKIVFPIARRFQPIRDKLKYVVKNPTGALASLKRKGVRLFQKSL